MKKITRKNLTSKMIYRMVKDFLIGIVLFFILNGGGISLLQRYLMVNGVLYAAEQDSIDDFQEYVNNNRLNITDTGAIKSWVQQRNLHEFIIYKGGKVYFDKNYQENIFPGVIYKEDFRFLYPIKFLDGQAELYIYSGFADKYFDVVSGLSIIISIVICLFIFGIELQEEIKNIRYLKEEVEKIAAGCMKDHITPRGDDEICQLASGVEYMRNQLLVQEETRQKMKKSQDELVLGMAHDLRTPLTGLFSYLEIIKKLEKDGKPTYEYTQKAFDKAEQLRTVSEQLFEYFLVSQESDSGLEEPENIQSAFEDYLSEFCVFLQCNGFCIETAGLSWKPVMVQINTDFFGRIMNNLISNIEKYASKDNSIILKILYTDTNIEISFLNGIVKPDPYVNGTGIGLKNIELMMEQMNGSATVERTEDTYCIQLSFPICRING